MPNSEYFQTLCSWKHIESPFYEERYRKPDVDIFDKRIQVIALSIIFGAFTFIIGGVFLYYALSARYKIQARHALPPPTLPFQMFKEYTKFLSSEDIKNLRLVSAGVSKEVSLGAIERAINYGLDPKFATIETSLNYLSVLEKVLRSLMAVDYLHGYMVRSRGYDSIPQTLNELKRLKIGEFLYISKFLMQQNIDDFEVFNQFLATCRIVVEGEYRQWKIVEEVAELAIFYNNGLVVRFLLELECFDISQPIKGNLPLWHAAKFGYVELVELFVSARPDLVNEQNLHGTSSLFRALYPSTFVSKALTISWRNKRNHYLRLAEVLLQYGADPNLSDHRLITPLMAASQYGDPSVIARLIDAGADIHAANISNYQALHYAVLSGRRENVEALLNRGAGINVQDLGGNTPLLVAIIHDHLEVAALLLERGCSTAIANNDGTTPLISVFGTSVSSSVNFVKLLMRYNADPYQPFLNGSLPIHFAAQLGFVEIVELFLNAGVPIDVVGGEEKTPLHFALSTFRGGREYQQETLQTIRFLIQNGASIDIENDEGQTARSLMEGYIDFQELNDG